LLVCTQVFGDGMQETNVDGADVFHETLQKKKPLTRRGWICSGS
jgi:hypothetical protein